jgi:hypothetical protein
MTKTVPFLPALLVAAAALCVPAATQGAAPAVLSGKPDNLKWTGHTPKAPSPLPRSQPPAKNMLVVDIRKLPHDWQRVAVCIQGLVNRSQPRIYTITEDQDKVWLENMRARGWVKAFRTVSGPRELVTKYRSLVKGAVIPDPAVPGSVNAAYMLAGLDNGIVATPAIAKQLGLPALHDLRGKWKTNAQAIEWSFNTLWPRLNHNAIAIVKDVHISPRDYLVQHKIFSFWITGPVDGENPAANPTAEARAMEKILAKIPANIACLGYPYAGENVGIQEGPGVSLLSQFGKYLIATDINPNLSVHSGIRVASFRQKHPPAPKLDRGKVYLSFIVSDGDNLQVWSNTSFPDMWKSPARGDIPVGWTISPSAAQLIPDVVDYFYRRATPNDAFLAAVSGVGYMYPDQYARRFAPADRARVFDGFLDQTAAADRTMDLSALWLMGITDDNLLARYAERIPNVSALFPDYGRRVSTYEQATYPTVNNVPVFHASNNWGTGGPPKQRIADVVRDIRAISPKGRPAFLHVFVSNWGASIPWMKEVMKQLGPGYVAVRPEHLGALYRQEMQRQQVIVEYPEHIEGIAGRPLTVSVGVRNATSKPMSVRTTFSGAMSSLTTARSLSIKPGVPSPFSLTAVPRAGTLTMSLRGPFGERTKTATVRLIPPAEVMGSLPDGALRFAGHYEAEEMGHRSGSRVKDAGAGNGVAWKTPSTRGGEEAAGYVVYGPYVALKPGKYLALFRMKRGPGTGPLATLDIASNGANDTLSKRSVSASQMPEGEYRSVAVPFTYKGGALETRVNWAGETPLWIDSVTVYGVK